MAYVFFRREVAEPRLEALREVASRLAKRFGLSEQEWWWNYRGDDKDIIVFGFAKGYTSDRARHYLDREVISFA